MNDLMQCVHFSALYSQMIKSDKDSFGLRASAERCWTDVHIFDSSYFYFNKRVIGNFLGACLVTSDVIFTFSCVI